MSVTMKTLKANTTACSDLNSYKTYLEKESPAARPLPAIVNSEGIIFRMRGDATDEQIADMIEVSESAHGVRVVELKTESNEKAMADVELR